MTQEILVPEVKAANIELLTSQLKAAAPLDCFGVKIYQNVGVFDLYIITSDTITPQLLASLKAIAIAHDPSAKTPEQQADITGKADVAALLAQADSALTQLASKRATFAGNQNLANAAPLLLEVTDDLVAAIKVLKYIVKRVN